MVVLIITAFGIMVMMIMIHDDLFVDNHNNNPPNDYNCDNVTMSIKLLIENSDTKIVFSYRPLLL